MSKTRYRTSRSLSHFELPFHLVKEYGGLQTARPLISLVRFATVCFERYKDKVKYWMTLMKSITKQIIKKIFAPFTNSGIVYKEGDDREAIMYQAAHYELVASALAVKAGKASTLILKSVV